MLKNKLLHVCGWAGCQAVTHDRYCEKHQQLVTQKWQQQKANYRKTKLAKALREQKQQDYDLHQRDKEATAFYNSRQWKQVREYVYARDGGRCQVCGNMITSRLIADHIHPLKYAPEEKLDTKNLWLLDYPCHYRKTKLEQTIAHSKNGKTKLTHLTREWWKRILTEKKGETINPKSNPSSNPVSNPVSSSSNPNKH